MKINSIGINAYQQVARANKPIQPNANSKLPESQFTLEPQVPGGPSRVSLKPRVSDINAAMNSSERLALENLIKIISQKNSAQSLTAGANRQLDNQEAIGRLIDVKV
jgi:hypothetical protein